jgi:hypothetical protein
MPTTAETQVILAHKARKAAAIVATLREQGVTAQLAREFDAREWKLAAGYAGVRPPDSTIPLILALLEAFEEREEHAVRPAAGGGWHVPGGAIVMDEREARIQARAGAR